MILGMPIPTLAARPVIVNAMAVMRMATSIVIIQAWVAL